MILRYLKRRKCVHRWTNVGSQVVGQQIGLGKHARTKYETWHGIHCGKCNTTKYFDSVDEMRVFKRIAEVNEVHSKGRN